MDVEESFTASEDGVLRIKKGTGGSYKGLKPGDMLNNLFNLVPELGTIAQLDLKIPFNKDSSRIGPKDWIEIARMLDRHRAEYDAFLIIHGTDTMAYTASALSLMLLGFKKPVVLTGSQMPLASARTDARQNLIDALTCAVAGLTPPYVQWAEVAICFGGKLMRGNRAQKVDSSSYQAFDSPGYPPLATLGIGVDWNHKFLLQSEGSYRPRFKLDPSVIRIPIVPGSDPRKCYGDLMERGVKGVVLESFGVGNMPDSVAQGWLPWLRDQTKKGLKVCLTSQCARGDLKPELYRAGHAALQLGVEAGPQMTSECAVTKLMVCLAHPDLPLAVPLAGEL
ncbi:MAG: Asparaginase/glutaminase [Monoraphidium minutum]|nr:MAG: Asparaginase/glutaminase [Monoraphidium minutum]